MRPLQRDLRSINPKERLFVITFVNDCIIIGPDKKNIRALKAQLGLKYVIEDRGPASYFLERGNTEG